MYKSGLKGKRTSDQNIFPTSCTEPVIKINILILVMWNSFGSSQNHVGNSNLSQVIGLKTSSFLLMVH